mmetsp:Transcript_303/g.1128  ORF Transcript_303/g.1128 Transcript_303/m.1128 type:complete len:828 (-) Transcript_303:938-3421(-)
MSRYDLLSLQGKAKRDPDGYRDDVLMQLQHYNALHGLFMLKPGKDFKAFADLTNFLAQVAKSYPRDMPEFHKPIVELLDAHYALLEPSLRRSLTGALILLHNRGSCALNEILPLFFKMFRVQDKQLRTLVFKHVVASVKRANKTKRDEALNRSVQSFLQSALRDENVAAAKKALAVLTELYRRNVWTDARTVNLVADATKHASPKILVAALKFFLGQDEAAEAAAEAGEEDSDEEEDKPKMGTGTKAGTSSGVSKEDVYRAYNKGVTRTKKKKQEKLKRQVASIRRANKKEEGISNEARFAAMTLVNDPQAFAERLFHRLQAGTALTFDTKMLLIQVLSRVVGLHRLHLMHLYPFLQRYVQPNQRDVTKLLAACATACHELVPPDALEPLLKQLVNQFVHDRARPEVVAVGINTVREICLRCPLVMHADLLQDLAQYKRARDKPVATAARALISLFRELAPGMLEKKDRGKGAELDKSVAAFGASEVAADRVAGAELLQKDMAKRRREERLAAEAARRDAEEDGEDGEEEDDDVDDEGDEDASDEEDEDEEEEEGVSDEDEEEGASDSEERNMSSDSEDAAGLESDSDGRVVDPVTGKKRKRLAPALSMDEKRALAKELTAAAERTGAPKPKVRKNGVLSLSELRRRAKEAARVKRLSEAEAGDSDSDSDSEKDLKIEHDRILQPEDFKRIKALRTATALGRALDKTGGKKAAETGAEEMRRMLRAADKSAQADRRVNPETLAAVGVKRAHDKESRVASIMAGREDRGVFGAAQDRKNKKSGGTSNVEKAKRKNLPLAARVKAAKNRRTSFVSKRVKDKQFKGRFRK